MILLLYIGDLFLTGNEEIIAKMKKRISIEFEMKYMGMVHYFLVLEVW